MKLKHWLKEYGFTLLTLAVAIAVGAFIFYAVWDAYSNDQIGTVGIDSVTQLDEDTWEISTHGEAGETYLYYGEKPDWVTGAVGGQFVKVKYNMSKEVIYEFLGPAEPPQMFSGPISVLLFVSICVAVVIWLVIKLDREGGGNDNE